MPRNFLTPVALLVPVLALLCGLVSEARAEPLPAPDVAGAWSKREPLTVEVANPHVVAGAVGPRERFRGFPAAELLDAVVGPGWRGAGRGVEFRAADGYVSRVPSDHLQRYSAWLVFERADSAPFVTDNIYLGQRDVPLGPWYLVWDNIGHPELIPLGDHYWPYQVVEMAVAESVVENAAQLHD